MLNNKDNIIDQLRQFGLSTDEARVYLELLKEPTSHLRLAHATGINRTKVYRLADQLEKRSLISRRTDDRGTFLVAADPNTLEIELVNKEEKVKAQRVALESVLPLLGPIKQGDTSSFVVHTYEGVEGFKQMLWHELKARDEQLIFGSGTIDDLIDDQRWAEKHRTMTVEAGYTIHEILNPNEKRHPFTLNDNFMQRYIHRIIPEDVLLLRNQTTIYNDTVAVYHWREDQKVGVEIINKNFAQTMRQMFEHYWQIAKPRTIQH